MHTPGELIFLTSEDVRSLHDEEIQASGGRPGVRDDNALESAVAQARQVDAFRQGDVVDMAAAYLFSIAMNHAFIDGNKRTAFVSCLTFLALNGVELGAPSTLEVALLATASKLLDKTGLTGMLRQLVILVKTDPDYYAAAHFREVKGRLTPSQPQDLR
jgi:death-on-curing protein